MSGDLIVILQTMSATCASACALFMYRFWLESHDRLFAYFASAFGVMALSWFVLVFVNPVGDALPYVYGLRSIAFGLIILATVDKNWFTRG